MREAAHPSKEVTRAAAATVSAPPAMGLTANCDTTYTAKHHSGKRPLASIKWIVMHSTEGDTALGAAVWFANPRSAGS